MERLEELTDRTESILRSHGYTVERISYPDDHTRRSIDLLAVREGKTLLVKVAEDAGDVAAADLRELQGCSRVLRGAGLVVAERDEGEEIEDIVAHEKMGVYVVSPESLEAALSDSLYVVRRQRSYYMRVDGSALRKLRLEHGYSLGDVAQMLSVSRRSVYLYEQGENMVSLPVALRLMEVFGEEIFKPINVIDEQAAAPPKTAKRTRLGAAISSAGMSVVETRHIPPNALAAGERTRIVVVVERRREQDFEKRLEESGRVASRIDAYVVTVTREYRSLARSYDFLIAKSVEEAAEIVRRLEEGAEE